MTSILETNAREAVAGIVLLIACPMCRANAGQRCNTDEAHPRPTSVSHDARLEPLLQAYYLGHHDSIADMITGVPA